MQNADSQKNCNSTYSLDGVMEYLNEQVRTLNEKQSQWDQERSQLHRKIQNLESQLQKQLNINAELNKKLKHRRTSSEDKTVIFNQTNISSYYPIIMMPKGTGWVCKQNLRSHLDSVRTLAWHGEYLISSGEDSLLKVWENGNCINTIRGHIGPVYASTESGNLIYTGGLEGVIREWEFGSLIKNGKCSAQQELHANVIWDLQHHPHQKFLLSSSADESIKLIATQGKTLEQKAEFRRKCQNGFDTPTSVQWLGTMFVSGFCKFSSLLIFDVQTQKPFSQLKYTSSEVYSQPNKILYSEFNQFIMASHEDKHIRFFDPKSAKLVKQIVAHTDSVSCISQQSNSPFFCSSSHDGSVRCWDSRNYRCLSDLPIHRKKYDQGANTVLYHPSEMMIAVGGADGLVKVLQHAE